MKKVLSLILALALCVGLCACGGSKTEPTEITVESAYAQLVEYAKNGEYLEAWRLTQRVRELEEYQDAQAYIDYCDGMRAYKAGGIGYAYSKLLGVPQVLDAQATIDTLKAQIGSLDGYYVSDNGQGSYLHLVIRNGQVASKVIGYTSEEQSFAYEDSDFMNDLVFFKSSAGAEILAIGRYSSLGEKLNTHYAITTFSDSTDLMVLKYADSESEFNTLNGLYKRVADLPA